ncbi:MULTISPECIES: hypothetical protein [Tsukamurella]|uniref:Uncharacterized protein n=2 Tax=Tsukamurella TaxID=2060 RepID=A0A5C5S1Z6_9ACTN|nr:MULTISPECIES: hypothetical protein [Tsukamurella]NMD57745.1 hypothetical protein [Tsukamurella columbiensis]TWS29457.1 hypothetical protein FK530_07940 [Tsukamurella conjunctivitidis]
MTLHVDCSTCPAKPRACGDCSVGFLLGPVVVAAPAVPGAADGAGSPAVTVEPGLSDAIAAFANEGMLPRLRVVPDQAKQAG